MTSASELFYNRRAPRFGRSSDSFGIGSGSDPVPAIDRTNRRHLHVSSAGGNHPRRSRIDPDGCDPLRQAPHHPPRTPPSRRPSPPPPLERDSFGFEENGHLFSSGNGSHSGSHVSAQDRLRISANDRLPGAVLLARERLLQRLRGVTLAASRRSNRTSSHSRDNDVPIGDDFMLVDAGDWETDISREWLDSIIPVGQEMSRQPLGLTQEALSSLNVEVFSVAEESDQQGILRALMECSICLESFLEGDKLIRLLCGHRYHFRCLDPWVRTCGACPYCRRGINVNPEG